MPWIRFVTAISLFVAGIANATLIALPGTSPQHAVARSYFPNALAFKVVDDTGAPISGAKVALSTASNFYPEPGPNCAPAEFSAPYSNCSGTTQADGTVVFSRLRALFAGAYSFPVKATMDGRELGTVTLSFTVDPVSTPATLTLVSDPSPRTVQMVDVPLAFRLTRDGVPLANEMVTVSAWIQGNDVQGNAGNGSGFLYTDANGVAKGTLRPSDGAIGSGVIKAEYVDMVAAAVVNAATPYTVTNTRGGFDLSLQGLWWAGTAQNGWGMSVVQHDHKLFNVLFVYDADGKPVWYVQPAHTWGNGFGGQGGGSAYLPRGTPWYAYDASKLVVGPPVGSASLIFKGERQADMGMTFFLNVRGTTVWQGTGATVAPQEFGRGGAAPIDGLTDMWWGGPEQNGWGIAIHQQQDVLFMVWFTYDENGAPTWFVMPGGNWRDGNTYVGSVYRTHGAPWFPGPYDASRLSIAPVGDFTLQFATKDRAVMQLKVDGRSASLDLVRQQF